MRKAAATGLLGVLATAAALAAPAFACSDNAVITVAPIVDGASDPSGSPAGGAGSDISVTGRQFLSPETGAPPVEIRWASDTGPVLVSVAGPSFSTRVTVPTAAAPGFYYVVAIQRNSSNTLAWKRVATFEVTAPIAANPLPPGPGSAGPGPVPAAPGPVPASPGPAPAAAGPSAVTAGPAAVPRPAAVNPARSLTTPVPAGSNPRSSAPAPASPTGVLPPTPSPGALGDGRAPAPAAVPAGVSDQAPIPATNDLWSALAPGGAPSLLDPAASSGVGHGAGLPVGAGLLGAGLAALAGTAAVTARRRLALARWRGSPKI